VLEAARAAHGRILLQRSICGTEERHDDSQKQAGVVKSDFPYDKVVAVQLKPIWDQ
jgi:hypothetical protein